MVGPRVLLAVGLNIVQYLTYFPVSIATGRDRGETSFVFRKGHCRCIMHVPKTSILLFVKYNINIIQS